MKTQYKKCFWKFTPKSFEGCDVNHICNKCTGYDKNCNKYIEAEQSDIPGILRMSVKKKEIEKTL